MSLRDSLEGPKAFEKKGICENYSLLSESQVTLGQRVRSLAGPTRLELATSGVTGQRSNQTELRPRRRAIKLYSERPVLSSEKAISVVWVHPGEAMAPEKRF